MTPVVLLDRLKEFVENHTKDIYLSVQVEKNEAPQERAPQVHKMWLPNKELEIQNIPYIVLQFITGLDDQEPGNAPDSECKIRIVVATYSKNAGEGAMGLLNVLTRLRTELLRVREVGDQFLLRMPLEYVVYPDNTSPFFLGEMLTTWE
ncbi:MAG: hypothetical protein LBS19_02765, partial [Clostridiales bacterium]|nr:hypothetical protein [Clostridiales bacterium]